MIFSELYSVYYTTIAKLIDRILAGDATERDLKTIVEEHAFAESVMTILPALKSGRWQLMHPDRTTPLTHSPTMPLTNLQKQWLKAISLDPKMKLFGAVWEGLEDVEPLFTQEDYYIYDQYGDGDPYENEGYIQRFRFLLNAIHEGAPIKLEMKNRRGTSVFVKCIPVRLEYSEKDDKFRLITRGCRYISVVNLARITSCARYLGNYQFGTRPKKVHHETVVLRILNERNMLERCMLHFAHFEKQMERLDKKQYLVKIRYDRDDEPEMVIRILSFGPLVEVLEPESFRGAVIERLQKQKNCGLK